MIDRVNLMKYLVMFFVVTVATKVIPSCGVLRKQAMYVGLVASSTFALLDVCYPQIVVEKPEETL